MECVEPQIMKAMAKDQYIDARSEEQTHADTCPMDTHFNQN